MAFGVTDTIVAGRYAEGALAALSVGSAIFISVFVVADGRAAGAAADLGRTARRRPHGRSRPLGAPVALPVRRSRSCSAWRCCSFPAPLLRWTEVPRGHARRRRGATCAVLAFALPPALLFRLFSTLNQSLGKPQLVTWLQLASLVRQAAAVDLVHLRRRGRAGDGAGRLRLGHAGRQLRDAGAARSGCCAAQPFYRDYRFWQRIEAPDWRADRASSPGSACRPAWRCWWR